MLSSQQLQKLWDVSDTILYPEAVSFMRHLVYEQDCMTLPASQVMGLLNVAKAANYAELDKFMKHQRDRNWPNAKRDIKTFYTELEKVLTTMRNKRVRSEFHLVREELNSGAITHEVNEVMAQLAHDFIQHIVAENGMIALKKAKERRRR